MNATKMLSACLIRDGLLGSSSYAVWAPVHDLWVAAGYHRYWHEKKRI